MKNNKNGITLIALVITIIVLLILAGISISLVTGQNGVLTRAEDASNTYSMASAKEQANMRAAGYVSEYMEKVYVDNDSTVGAMTTGEYVLSQMNGQEDGDYRYSVSGSTITVTSKTTGQVLASGTVDDNGGIAWSDTVASGGGSTTSQKAVTNLAKAGTIKVGDYVNYTPSSGSITVTSAQTGADSDQTFSTSNDSGMTWRVLSVNSSTGEVKIVGSPTSNQLTLNGRAGFGNAETVLNSIAGIYGGGRGAASVRSITEDDVFDAIGYDKVANYFGDVYTYKGGEFFTETWNSTTGTATYSTTTTTPTTQNPVTIHNTAHNRLRDNINDSNRFGIAIASETLENGTAQEKSEMQVYWDMLIGGNYEEVSTNWDTTGCFNYWCASRFAYCTDSGVCYCVRNVYDSKICGGIYPDETYLCECYYAEDSDTSDVYDYEISHGVVPIVTLQSNIEIEQDNNDVWNFVQ